MLLFKTCDYLFCSLLNNRIILTRLETVLPKCYRRWRRRTRGSAYRVIWKYSLPHRRKAPRSLARPADVRISRRDSTVIRRAVKPKSKISWRRRDQGPPCRQYQSPSRSRWRWIFVAIGTRINWMRSRRNQIRSFLRIIPLRTRTSKADRRLHRWNEAVGLSRATYAAGNSAVPAFPYTSLSAWR